MTAVRPLQKEFERLAAELLAGRYPPAPARGPQPSITREAICQYAIEFVDRDGLEALTVRRLAADLEISTRTLYKRIGSRANLVAELIEMHTGRIQFEFHPCGTWEDMIWDWCQQLHRSLASRPHLTLMAQGRVPAVMRSSVQALIAAVVRDGVPVEVAGECCWSLADLTINDAVELAREMTGGESVTTNGSVQLSKRTSDAIKWVLRGVGAAIESPDR